METFIAPQTCCWRLNQAMRMDLNPYGIRWAEYILEL
jgi:hypothetical protein